MEALLGIGIIIVCSLVLVKAVSLFLTSSSKIALHLGISGYAISFLLIAASTSMPEAVVGVTAALDGNPILSFGNAIGANVALLTLVVAIPVLLKKEIGTRSILHSKDLYFAAFFITTPLLLSMDGQLSRIDGAILLLAYITYVVYVIKRSRKNPGIIEELENPRFWKHLGIFFIALILVLAASEGIVQSAKTISISLGLGLGFIGLTIAALGTSLPELSYTITAINKNKQKEVLGNIMGSVIANSTLVLGITSSIHPIDVRGSSLGPAPILFMIVTLIIFLRAAMTKEKLDKTEAAILLGTYFIFLLVESYLHVVA